MPIYKEGHALSLPVCEFRSDARVTRPEEFKRALQTRPFTRSRYFICHFVQDELCQSPGTARLGLIVPKRFAKKATTRNAIKRVIREAFRMQRSALRSGDLIIRLKSAAPVGSLRSMKSLIRCDIDAMLQIMSLR